MNASDATDPAIPAPSADATVRLPAGVSDDPHRTQPLKCLEPPPADSTVKLPRAELVPGSDQTQKLAVSLSDLALSPDQTQKLAPSQANLALDAGQTQKLVLPEGDRPPLRLQPVDPPAEAAGQTQKLPVRTRAAKPFGWKLPLGLGVLVVLGAAAYLVFNQGSAPQPLPVYLETATPPALPRDVQVYLEQANAGDARAMRMLGAMYYNGLNVPRDPEKGIYWYRKAAEKGSDAARKELSNLEGGR
jgi:hypothetical protein